MVSYTVKLLPRGDRAKETARPDLINASSSSGEPSAGYKGTGRRDEDDSSVATAELSTSREGIWLGGTRFRCAVTVLWTVMRSCTRRLGEIKIK